MTSSSSTPAPEFASWDSPWRRNSASAPINLTLLLTHTHWDHIQGLPFFLPAYKAKNSIRVLGYEGARAGLATILAAQMEVPFFPVSWKDLPGTIKIQELKKMEFSIGKVRVRSRFLNHPGVCAGYRLFTKEGSIAFLPDNEPFEPLKLKLAARDGTHPHRARAQAAVQRSKLVEFLKDTDVLILDAQYTDEKYQEHIGWGHGALSRVVSLALEARAKKLFLFHHDPVARRPQDRRNAGAGALPGGRERAPAGSGSRARRRRNLVERAAGSLDSLSVTRHLRRSERQS